MLRVTVNLGERSYPIVIDQSFEGLKNLGLPVRAGKQAVIVADAQADVYHGDALMNALKECGLQVLKLVIPSGEAHKTIRTIEKIWTFLAENRCDRRTTLYALGGGVTGDITGFAAATWMRGVNFVQIPTTLLAMSDSSVGGKTGVDFDFGKNMVGAFHQPKLVYMNVATLKTLPEREVRAGMAEVIKHGIIQNPEFLEYIEYNAKKIMEFDPECLMYITKVNCSIKGAVVEADETEAGLRATLNFGHTFGHGIESAAGFRLLHGECVAAGMMAEFLLAERLGYCTSRETAHARRIIESFGLPVTVTGLSPEDVFERMTQDKKARDGKLLFVLPRSLGEVELHFVEDKSLILAVLSEILVPDGKSSKTSGQ